MGVDQRDPLLSCRSTFDKCHESGHEPSAVQRMLEHSDLVPDLEHARSDAQGLAEGDGLTLALDEDMSSTPRRCSSPASMSPTGPAPTIKTSVVVLMAHLTCAFVPQDGIIPIGRGQQVVAPSRRAQG